MSTLFSVSRRTIHNWMESDQLDGDMVAGAACPSTGHKLYPYKEIIGEHLGGFPMLAAQRLFDECWAAGHPGGYSRVRDYVREVRLGEPLAPAVWFETPPGRQGQVDFGSFRLPWDRRHALLVVLGHSRRLAVTTPAQFDFAFQPSVKWEQVESLRERSFLSRQENVILFDPLGVGKTHQAISLAIAA